MNILITSMIVSTRPKIQMDKVVHFEIPADNTKRASEFYNKAFGWTLTPIEMGQMEYTMIKTTDSDENGTPKNPGAINGGMGKRSSTLQHPVVTIHVQDINQALASIEKLGGKKVQEKMPVGDMGFAAYFKDTEGNIIGLWQMAQNAGM